MVGLRGLPSTLDCDAAAQIPARRGKCPVCLGRRQEADGPAAHLSPGGGDMRRLPPGICLSLLLLLTGGGRTAARAQGPVPLPFDQHFLFLVDQDHASLSGDGGHTWQSASAGLPATFAEVDLVGLSGPDSRALLATDTGLLRFAEGKWQPVALPQPEPIRQLLV